MTYGYLWDSGKFTFLLTRIDEDKSIQQNLPKLYYDAGYRLGQAYGDGAPKANCIKAISVDVPSLHDTPQLVTSLIQLPKAVKSQATLEYEYSKRWKAADDACRSEFSSWCGSCLLTLHKEFTKWKTQDYKK